MLIAFTSLPGFVTIVFRGMPTVWRGRHRLLFCWLIFMQAVSPGRKTLAEMARWTPATLTAWRFGRVLKAAYWNVHLIVSWLAQDLVATLPAPANGILYLFGDGSSEKSVGIAVLASLLVMRVCHHEIVPGKPWRIFQLQHALRLRVMTNQVEHTVKVKMAKACKAA